MLSKLVPFDEVANYKHPHLVARLQRKCSMSHEEAEQLFLDTKQFMYICAKYPDGLAPTKVIDEGWHNFILFTRDYRRFCLDFLGRFIHHEPIAPGTTKNGELIQKAVNLARSTFGDNLSENWSVEEGADCDKCAPEPSCNASRSPSPDLWPPADESTADCANCSDSSFSKEILL